MATTTQRTILSSAKIGTISPEDARRLVRVVKYRTNGTTGKFGRVAYKKASHLGKTTKKK